MIDQDQLRGGKTDFVRLAAKVSDSLRRLMTNQPDEPELTIFDFTEAAKDAAASISLQALPDQTLGLICHSSLGYCAPNGLSKDQYADVSNRTHRILCQPP